MRLFLVFYHRGLKIKYKATEIASEIVFGHMLGHTESLKFNQHIKIPSGEYLFT